MYDNTYTHALHVVIITTNCDSKKFKGSHTLQVVLDLSQKREISLRSWDSI